MKVFIAGARSIKTLSPEVKSKMMQIYDKGYDVIVGDCYGVDTSVQRFYSNLSYDKVIVYASNGKARNNIGGWKVQGIITPDNVSGFEYYRQKDIAMANEADYGFMIWDGESKGTLSNIVTLISQDKKVLVYYKPSDKMVFIKNSGDLNKLIAHCPAPTQTLYTQIGAFA